jgi:hypothetical protein
MEYFLAGPGRGADHVAEILWPDGGLAGEHIGLDVSKGRLEPALVGMILRMLMWGLPSAGNGRPAFRKVLRHSRPRKPFEHRTFNTCSYSIHN